MQLNNGKAKEYKVLLGIISICAGLFSFYFIATSPIGILKGAVWGGFVSLLYPVCANLSATSILRLFKFALIWDKNYRWAIEYRVLAGAFWPVTLPFALIIALYSAIINRLFREH